MSELSHSEREPAHSTIGDRIRNRIDRFIRPVSAAREKQFREIINVLPEGAMKKSYETMLPRLREMLKIKDFDTATGEIITRSVAFLFGGTFAAMGIAVSVGSGTPIGLLHAAVGLGLMGSAFAPFGPIARERKAIDNETITFKDFYSSPAGKDAARAWDKLPGQNTDQIVRALILGTPTMRGTPGGAFPMPNMPGTGGLLR